MKKIFYIIILSISSIYVFAHPLTDLKYETKLEVANECFDVGDYVNAMEYFNQANDEQDELATQLNIAECYYMLRDYKNATKRLDRFIKKDKNNTFPVARLLYGKSLKRDGNYQESLNVLKDYALNTDDPELRNEAILEIKGLEMFKTSPENVEMEFIPLDKDINKGFSIYGIQKRYSNDSIYFGSFNTAKKITLDGKNNEVKEDSKSKKSKSKSKSNSKSSSKSNSNKSNSARNSNNDLGGGGLAGDGKGNGKEKMQQEDNDENDNSSDSKEAQNEGEKSHGQLFYAVRDQNGEYKNPFAMDNRINREEYYSVYPAFSTDGNKLFYTRLVMEGTVVLESKIMYSEFKNGDWTAPVELPTVNGDFESKMPAYGELLGQPALFFVSDMEGGIGGYDIYYSLINKDGTLQLPVNIGKEINTVDDEITPYYVDGTLYFSTNGLPSLGGFDIYKSKWNGKTWSKPENLGKGYNSNVDDIGLSLTPDGRSGFLLSNRKYDGKKKLTSETCCNHAFKISARELVIQLLVKVTDSDNNELDNASVQLLDVSKAKPKSPETKSNFSGNTFNFLLDSDKPYRAIVTREGYDPATISFNTAGIFDDYTIEKEVQLKKSEPEYEIVKTNQAIRLSNIYYDYDDYKILPEAEDDLAKLAELMEKYPDMVIELSSHTDSRGPDSYNLKLSQKRADAAKKWLVENGISADRIKAIGYGEKYILNKCKNGVNCTDEEHRYNRRTEFKIISGPTEITIEKQVFKNKEE
ncbi:MAG: OmpA family protein [Saprospiraceae bacterium]